MKNLKVLVVLCLSLSASVFASVPKGGLICHAPTSEGKAALNSLVTAHPILQTYYGAQGGFTYDSKSGALTVRSTNGLATYCVDFDGGEVTQVICAPWGQAARLLYGRETKNSNYGRGLIETIDPSLSAIGSVFLSCKEF